MPSRNRSFEAFEATKYTLQMSRRMNYESVSHSNKKSLRTWGPLTLRIALVLNWTLARVQKSKDSTQNYKILCYYCKHFFPCSPLSRVWLTYSHRHVDTATKATATKTGPGQTGLDCNRVIQLNKMFSVLWVLLNSRNNPFYWIFKSN